MSTLFVLATPIGNLEDCGARTLRILSEVNHVACEDTRITRRIFERYGIAKPASLFACHEHNQRSVERKIIDLLESGEDIALACDAGVPGVSDPGFNVVRAALEAHHEVDVIPGPTAPITALIISGLPCSSFTFKGFPPRKAGALRRFFEMDRDLPHTLVFFESKFRLHQSLAAAYEVLGDRQSAVCIELTKKFQTVKRGYLSALVPLFEQRSVKGEITVVIAGDNAKFTRPAQNPP
ncbi:MAG: 16S rRNA (cytidine(1402)-2'-O)-methyltransferase [Gammaproteobacteria bacterium]|nr:16S rRNA (cytidine(1402)-2'-O)-methyltransferase [Gammaproteobacteria bacterium]